MTQAVTAARSNPFPFALLPVPESPLVPGSEDLTALILYRQRIPPCIFKPEHPITIRFQVNIRALALPQACPRPVSERYSLMARLLVCQSPDTFRAGSSPWPPRRRKYSAECPDSPSICLRGLDSSSAMPILSSRSRVDLVMRSLTKWTRRDESPNDRGPCSRDVCPCQEERCVSAANCA